MGKVPRIGRGTPHCAYRRRLRPRRGDIEKITRRVAGAFAGHGEDAVIGR
jgi:hypothetical protein